ncbi:hypothetical protein EYF80_021436 [Liparis tanakae]|uniref:Uncharacterized protein n=1 Tax=Liparis tanakae TaxID=230148 RepID=A0A4Z2HTV7_9TELE|nr:hypothetical protein EYF80_021436 [Liparis tanakae]
MAEHIPRFPTVQPEPELRYLGSVLPLRPEGSGAAGSVLCQLPVEGPSDSQSDSKSDSLPVTWKRSAEMVENTHKLPYDKQIETEGGSACQQDQSRRPRVADTM